MEDPPDLPEDIPTVGSLWHAEGACLHPRCCVFTMGLRTAPLPFPPSPFRGNHHQQQVDVLSSSVFDRMASVIRIQLNCCSSSLSDLTAFEPTAGVAV